MDDDAIVLLVALILLSRRERSPAVQMDRRAAPSPGPRPAARLPAPPAKVDPEAEPAAPRAAAPRGAALRSGQLTVTLPIHLSGVERMFAGASTVTGRLETAVGPAMAEIERRATSAAFRAGTAPPVVRATETGYGYLATIAGPVRFAPGRHARIVAIVRDVVLSAGDVRARTRGEITVALA